MTNETENDYLREYDEWNRIKQKIQLGENLINVFPQEGEVWMSSLGKNIGFEQNGSGSNFSRPLLVVKKFNNHMFWCIPLSSKQKSFDFYHNFIDPNEQKVSAILAQLRLVSVKRLKRKLYEIPSAAFAEIKSKLRAFIA